MPAIVIKYDGTDITDHVEIESAEFVYRTDGKIGECSFRVLDRKNPGFATGYFKPGSEVTVDVDAKRVWGGYIEAVKYHYPLSVMDVTDHNTVPRYWQITGVDYNILFQKRVVWDQDDPTKQLKIYRPSEGSVTDKEIIRDIINDYLDLSGDGFESGGGNQISLAQVEELGEIYWVENCQETFQAASPGNSWGQAMRSVCEWSGGIFYIGPANPSQTHKGPTLYYHDVNSVTGPYELNDRPASSPGSAGVQDFQMSQDGGELATEALVWGAGMGSTEMVFHRETASTQLSTYGRFQWGDFASSMYLTECIKHRAKTHIHGSRLSHRGHKKPREIWKATVFTPDFQVGDTVDLHSYVFGVQDNVPIREMKITFINPTEAKFQMILSHYMDATWTTSMWWDPDDPGDPDDDDDGDPNDNWRTEFIPIGIGPIITPVPGEPNESDTQLIPGPDFLPYGIVRTRTPSGDTDRKLGFGGNDWDFGTYMPRFYNHPWVSPICCCWVGLGCWDGDPFTCQFWFAATPGMPVYERPDLAKTLYILGDKISRAGIGGGVLVSFVTDGENGPGYAFNAQEDARQAPPDSQGDTSFSVEGPLRGDPPAFSHFYSGTWGSYVQRPTLWVKANGSATGLEYLVFTPLWEVNKGGETDAEYGHRYCADTGVYCDNSYVGLPAAGQGPPSEGFGGSGFANLPSMEHTWYYNYAPNPYDQSPSPIDGGETTYYPGPTEKEYYTAFPYVPGTLSVEVDGIALRLGQQFWELDPTTGHFKVHISGTGVYSNGGFTVRYMMASPTASPHPGFGDFYDPETDDPGHVADVEGGRIYRPKFQSQFGYRNILDAWNASAACAAMFLDRATHGFRLVNPVQFRIASGYEESFTSLTLSQIADTLEDVYEEAIVNPGPVSWATFKSYINSQRGAIITGSASALLPYGLHPRNEYTDEPFTGPHALYINEIRAEDGYLFCYDPAFKYNSKYGITPGWYPPAAIRAYAAYSTGSTDQVYAIYTQKTPKI